MRQQRKVIKIMVKVITKLLIYCLLITITNYYCLIKFLSIKSKEYNNGNKLNCKKTPFYQLFVNLPNELKFLRVKIVLSILAYLIHSVIKTQ